MLTEDERASIVNSRVQRSHENWHEVKGIVENEYWYAAASRLYHACYYTVSALLVKHGYSANTHSGTIRLLGQHFVSKGIVSVELGRFYSGLFELRQTGDYDDWHEISSDDILPLMPTAATFLSTIEQLINE